MVISKDPQKPARPNIALVGEETSFAVATEAFVSRGYKIAKVDAAQFSDKHFVGSIDSIILIPSEKKLQFIAEVLDNHGKRLLDHDCRIYIRLSSPQSYGSSESRYDVNDPIRKAIARNGLPLANPDPNSAEHLAGTAYAPFVFLCSPGTTWQQLADLVIQFPAGPSPNWNLSIDVHVGLDGAASQFLETEDLLVRRAFHDCKRVDLVPMTDGLSGVTAYRAYASLEEGALGPVPYQYFTKIGERAKVIVEAANYHGNAMNYVPFYLGPRLIDNRCGLGCEQGILVSNLVGECASLRDCASTSAAVPAIANLFNRTLRAWHDTSRVETGHSLVEMILRFDRLPLQMPTNSDRMDRARELGAKRELHELIDAFNSRSEIEDVRVGAIHGDLHATNILVRGTDAVLIDFEKQQNDRPLLFDPASLEGGLFVDAFKDDPRDVSEILASVLPLYNQGVVLGWLEPCETSAKSGWFFDCVKQIRLHARHLECSPRQYATVLVATLLKKSANDHPSLTHGKRHRLRAAAYVLAEYILFPPA